MKAAREDAFGDGAARPWELLKVRAGPGAVKAAREDAFGDARRGIQVSGTFVQGLVS